MLINCPNCNASYEVNPDIIPQNGRKLRCSGCGEVFWCNPHDEENPARKIEEIQQNQPVLDNQTEISQENTPSETNLEENVEPEIKEEASNIKESEKIDDINDDGIDDDVNMQDIFQRLSLQSDEISLREKNMNPLQRGWHKFMIAIGWHKKTNRILIYSIFGAFALLFLLYFRVEITRKVPFMNIFYSAVGLDAIIPGEGLEFRNVTRREYELDDIPQLEIRGFIDNPTNREIEADLLHVEVLDKDGGVVQQQDDALPVPYFTPKARVPFSVVVVKPSALGKYIVVTFAKQKD